MYTYMAVSDFNKVILCAVQKLRWGMALTVDILHRHGQSINSITAKKDCGKVVLAINIAAKRVIHTVNHYNKT